MYVCAEALTKYNQPSICPWAHSSSARPAAQGTPAPVAPLQVLVLRPPSQTGRQLITEPSEMWPWSLYPAASLQSPPLLHAQIHTLMGSQPDPRVSATLGLDSQLLQLYHTDGHGGFSGLHGHSQVFSYSFSCFTVLSHRTPRTSPHLTLPRGPL